MVVAGLPDQAALAVIAFGILATLMLFESAYVVQPRSTMRAEAAAAAAWLGLCRPTVSWPRSSVKAALVWCLVVPVALAGLHFLGQLALAQLWSPVVDSVQQAARSQRRDMIVGGGWFSGVVLIPVFVAAIPEEVQYRSLVLVVQRMLGAWTSLPGVVRVAAVGLAAATSVAVFALSHAAFGPTNVVSAAIGGAFYTGLAVYTRSLWPAIVCHAAFDAMAISLTMF
ncbi:CPBP family intramembrane glutamic endopeptidase [Nocardia fluminea]|uniref:CPBP family intramembrane glutamic endopeptidase n=1 Tax=Nocardia fluminea TaxID=134984 RepID=UPI003D12DE41